MVDAFTKSVKWCFLMVFAIGGIYGFSEAGRAEDVRYLMISTLCFGSVYLLFRTWSELSNKIMVYSICIILALGFVAQEQYVPYWLYSFADIDITGIMGFFRVWAALTATAGLALMMAVFYKFDNDRY